MSFGKVERKDVPALLIRSCSRKKKILAVYEMKALPIAAWSTGAEKNLWLFSMVLLDNYVASKRAELRAPGEI